MIVAMTEEEHRALHSHFTFKCIKKHIKTHISKFCYQLFFSEYKPISSSLRWKSSCYSYSKQ